jgi:hypothetical protein
VPAACKSSGRYFTPKRVRESQAPSRSCIGDFAIRYGYYRYQTDVMVFTILLIVVFVQVLQFTGNLVVRKLDKRL